MNIHASAAYAAHLLTSRSTAGHGVHSPLMFSFITEVIGGHANKRIIEEVRMLRWEMLSDSRVVKVTDMGAGSTLMHGRERSIRQIAAAAALPAREAALLMRMAANLDSVLRRVPDQQPDQPPIILELGTSLGISTLALALAAPHRRVITVEGCPALAAIARENLLRHGIGNAEVLNLDFSEALNLLKERGTKVGMAFIDGNHRGAALIDYTYRIMEMGEEMIIVADDIHMNRDMIQSWRSLCPRQSRSGAAMPHSGTGSMSSSATGVAMPPSGTGSMSSSATGADTAPPGPQHDNIPATASVETFRLGILFCLQNLTPGHYRIRY